MKKKKVLFVVHQLNFGGVQKSLISALNAIDHDENDVTLYIRKNRINLIDDVNKNVSKIIVNEDRTRYYRKPFVVFLMILEFIYGFLNLSKKKDKIHQILVDYINEAQMRYEKHHYFNNDEDYDVAVSYIQGYTTKFVANYITAKKKITFYHVSTSENEVLHREILPIFDIVVGVNESVKEFLQIKYPEINDKVISIRNYVDAQNVIDKSKIFNPRTDNSFYLCSCGRFASVKGFDLAVKSAYLMKNQNIDFKWLFVGDGPEKAKIVDMIKKYGLENKIILTGMQENPYPYIAACDIYVQPSYEEAQPLTIIEAMILCKPIVSTDTVGGKALVIDGKYGFLSERNEQSLSEKIIMLMNNESLKTTIEKNLKEIDYKEEKNKYKNKINRILELE